MNTLRWFLLLATLVGFEGRAVALSPAKSITQYGHRVWQTDEGLPQNGALSVAQTLDGYVWIGTEEGLVRFDGTRFKVYSHVDFPGLAADIIQTLWVDRDNTLWIGTYGGGVSRYKDGKFTTIGPQEGLPDLLIRSLYGDHQGNLWIGTNSHGMFRLRAGNLTAFTTKDGLPGSRVNAIAGDQKDHFWIGTNQGLAEFADGKFRTFTSKDGLPENNVSALWKDSEGLWIGTNGGGLAEYRDHTFSLFTTKDGLPSNRISSLCKDSDGNLWIGTFDAGLARLSRGRITGYSSKNGLSSDAVRSIIEDREGNLWVGTSGGGLNQFINGKLTTYSAQEGLASEYVWTVIQDHEGALWLGTNTGGVYRFQYGKFKAYTTREGLSDNLVSALAEGPDGSLWIGTSRGLNRLRGGKFTTYTTRQGLPNDRVGGLYVTRDGSLWVGMYGGKGVARFKDEKFTVLTQKDGFEGNDVVPIVEDRDGSLWFGTDSAGLVHFKNGRFETLSTPQGLSKAFVLALHQDADGVLWIGTAGGGLNRYGQGKFTVYTTRDGLLSDTVFAILEDDSANLWISSNKGILEVSKKQLNDFAENKIHYLEGVSYGAKDGMKSGECNGDVMPSGLKARDGSLWFPTSKGIVRIEPGNLKRNPHAPLMAVEKLLLNNRVADTSPPSRVIESPPGNGDLEIHYTALSFVAPMNVKFMYRLEGYNETWVNAKNRRVAYYTNLPPRHYTFRVIACNDDGVWNNAGVFVQLYLKPHLYQTVWFYGLTALFLLGGVVSIHRLRVRRLKARETELAQHVEEAVAKIKVLRGLLPICSSCKKVRDDTGYWNQIEVYVRDHSEADFSHGICPECMNKLYPDLRK